MKKRLSCTAVILLLCTCALLASCDGAKKQSNAAVASAASDTNAVVTPVISDTPIPTVSDTTGKQESSTNSGNPVEELPMQSTKDRIFGFTPDGKMLVCGVEIYLLNPETGESIPAEADEDLLQTMKGSMPVWDKSGSFFILGNASKIPNELIVAKGLPIVVYRFDGSKLVATEIKTDLTKQSFAYACTLSYDEKSVVYCQYGNPTTIHEVGIESGEDKLIYTEKAGRLLECVEIDNGIFLCRATNEDNSGEILFTYNANTGKKKEINNFGDSFMLDIAGWSLDRHTVLVNHWVKDGGDSYSTIDQSGILVFGNNAEGFEYHSVSFTPGQAINTAFSPKGDYFVAAEKTNDGKWSVNSYSVPSLARKELVYSDKMIGMLLPDINGVFLGGDKLLLYKLESGWSLYRLN